MPIAIGYDNDSRMEFTGLLCDCGSHHDLPHQDVYVGTGLIPRLPHFLRKRTLGSRCVLVADNNTFGVAGRQVYDTLQNNGFSVSLCVIRRPGEMEPDERACGEVLLTLQRETEFLISVGSGSLTDITRVVAERTGLPFVSVGTAPSMDGYTSVVAPLLLRGVKIHRAAHCPEIIVCDLDILRTAPMDMVRSGFGDVLGKYIAIADWRLGKIINDEPYCPLCGEIVLTAVDKLLTHIDGIRKRTETGIRVLTEALLLAGLTIMIIGHTRAVASVEHNIVHYWDMMRLMRGEKQPPHGTAVGISTLLVWPLFLRFANEAPEAFSVQDILSQRKNEANRKAWMVAAYGEEAARTIMEENPEDFLSPEEQERRIRRVQDQFSDIKTVIAGLPPFENILQAMHQLGAPTTPEEIGMSREVVNWSMHCGKDYRSRYSLMKMLDECGLLETYLSERSIP